MAITGTDLELAGMCHWPAAVKQSGSLAVPAHRLAEYVKMLPEGDLHLKDQASHWLALSCGRSRSRIAGSAVDSYPELPKPPQEGVTISCAVLARLAEKVIFANATEQNSTNLTGALLKLEPTGPTMVATDGHRLALVTTHLDIPGLEKTIEILIPKKALMEFLRFSEGRNDQVVRCSVTENHLFFVWKERLLLSRRLAVRSRIMSACCRNNTAVPFRSNERNRVHRLSECPVSPIPKRAASSWKSPRGS